MSKPTMQWATAMQWVPATQISNEGDREGSVAWVSY
jgi:hypothetical protein